MSHNYHGYHMLHMYMYMCIYIYIYAEHFSHDVIHSSDPLPLINIVFSPPARCMRVVRFYVNSRSSSSAASSASSPDLNYDDHSRVFAAGPQPRPATTSVRCRTSTTTIHAQCSLPDLNHDHPRPVFAAGPQPRPATPSVRCRTSTTTINAQCSLPDLNSYAKSYAR